MLNLENVQLDDDSSSSSKSSSTLRKNKAHKVKVKYIDPITGAHFDYLNLFERIYDLKRLRKQIDELRGPLNCDTSQTTVRDSLKDLKRREIVFKETKRQRSIFSKVSEQLTRSQYLSSFAQVSSITSEQSKQSRFHGNSVSTTTAEHTTLKDSLSLEASIKRNRNLYSSLELTGYRRPSES